MGPFSVTGQPNAMGGREVGGLANMLAAHMEIENPEHRRIVQDFWGSPAIAAKPALKAVDLFRAVEDGRVKALWIMGTNPADSMPEADRVREAIRNCPFVVVSDVCCATDTTALADVLLPSAAWGEKHGTVTNSERRVSRQRAFLAAPGEAMPDWWQLCEVAQRMGFGDAFAYRSPGEIFAEYARLTAAENDDRRDLDLGALADISDADYAALEPFQWPLRAGERPGETRFFADGRFYHADGKARFVATPFRAPAARTSDRYPLILNTGRIRDQWHTMTRTAKTPRLMAHIGEPFVEIHPDDAQTIGVATADLAEIESAHGRAVLRVVVADAAAARLAVRADALDRAIRLAGARRCARSLRRRSGLRPAGAEDHRRRGPALRRRLACLRSVARAGCDRPRRLFRHRACARRLARGACWP